MNGIALSALLLLSQTQIQPALVKVRPISARAGGSGCAVGYHRGQLLILTAGHLLDEGQKRIQFPDGTTVSSRLLAKHPGADLALLVCPSVTYRVPIVQVAAKVDLGDAVHACGWAKTASDPVHRQWLKWTVFADQGDPTSILAPLQSGMSGGPVIQNGQVVGVISQRGYITTQIVPHATVRAFVVQNTR